MEHPIRTYLGKATRLGPPISVEEAMTKIHSLVDAGHPLFAKEVLREIGRQLRNTESKEDDQKIFVKGLDGVIVEFAIETGNTHQSLQPSCEFIVQKPCIGYLSMQALTSSFWNRTPDLAYCNVRLHHYRALRNVYTKELCGARHIMSKEETRDFFQAHSQAWEVSEPCKQLRSTLRSILEAAVDIHKIVGFALGSIASKDQSVFSTRLSPRSAFQHALVLTLRDILSQKREKSCREISCYVQDPIYTDIDKLVLESSGINVLDDPEGFIEVDDETLVVSCGPNVPVKQIVLDLANPAVMIWDKIIDEEEEPVGTDPDSRRVRNLVRSFYNEIEFPGDREYFGELATYIRHTEISSISSLC